MACLGSNRFVRPLLLACPFCMSPSTGTRRFFGHANWCLNASRPWKKVWLPGYYHGWGRSAPSWVRSCRSLFLSIRRRSPLWPCVSTPTGCSGLDSWPSPASHRSSPLAAKCASFRCSPTQRACRTWVSPWTSWSRRCAGFRPTPQGDFWSSTGAST